MIFWAALLGLSTTIFPEPYKDNAFYVLMLGYVTFVSVCIGLYAFMDKKAFAYKFLRVVTLMNAVYFGLGTVGEIINIFTPFIVLNDIFDNQPGYVAAFVFEVGLIWAFYIERKRLKR